MRLSSRSLPSPVLAVASILLGAGLGALPASSATGATTGTVRAALPAGSIKHIIVIELENQGFSTTFASTSPATYLNGVLRKKGELLSGYFGTGHFSLDNYIAQVSGQSPTQDTQADSAQNGAAFVDVSPGTTAPSPAFNPGQVTGQGCVYPTNVQTIADQLDAKYPPSAKTHVAAWRAYEEDMGSNPVRDGGTSDPTGGTDCAHPAANAPVTAQVAIPSDQYATRHNPFVWFHSLIDHPALCAANDVPLGTLSSNGRPNPKGHLARDLRAESSTPRFAFITPNLCNDGHDSTCAGPNSAGGHVGGLAGADAFLRHWMPLILGSPAYRSGNTLVMVTFDEGDVNPSDPTYAAACCNELPGPNTNAPGNGGAQTNTAPGGGQVGAVLLNARFIRPGSADRTGQYNHYSALRSFEDLLGLTTGGADGLGHVGYAATTGMKPFGRDVFNQSG